MADDLKEEKKFSCELCDYHTVLKHNLTRHMNSPSHKLKTGEIQAVPKEPFSMHCQYCKITVTDKSNWAKHILTKKHKTNETGINVMPIVHCFECTWCKYNTKYRNMYVKHIFECSKRPRQPIIIEVGLRAINAMLRKLKDPVNPRYVGIDYITNDPEIIKEKIIFYEKQKKDEEELYERALKMPPDFKIEDIIKEEFIRNKCYKTMRDEEFERLIQKAYDGEL